MIRMFLAPAVIAAISLVGLGLALFEGQAWWPAGWAGALAPLAAIARGFAASITRRRHKAPARLRRVHFP